MNIEEALTIIDEIMQPGKLTTLQELIFRKCWEGKTYQEIAKNYDYDPNYLRAIGSHIWQLISEAYQEDVSKQNFRDVLKANLPKKILKPFNVEFPDGIIPINSYFYIDRPPLEKDCAQEILSPGSLLCIKAGQKMGKTSLLNRTLNILSAIVDGKKLIQDSSYISTPKLTRHRIINTRLINFI